MAGRKRNMREMNTTSFVLFGIRVIYLVIAIAVVISIIRIQYFWKPDQETFKYFIPPEVSRTVDPVRGTILATDGRILAAAMPMYRIEMDCSVRREEFKGKGEKGAELEKEWRNKALRLSEGLEEIIGEKSASQYYNEIISKRAAGKHDYKISSQVTHEQLLKLKQLPLFNESSYRGGLIVSKLDTREYPYGSMARRVIGYVKNNKDTTNNKLGIEGRYDKILHGKEGHQYMKQVDGHKRIIDLSSEIVKVEDGKDVRTTIDVDIQNIADREMRKFLMDSRFNDRITEGCTAIMEVRTGAIRAVVNLRKNNDGSVGETYNYFIGRKGEPGSVFKPVSIMTLIEDGKIKDLSDSVPTFKGLWEFKGKVFEDIKHLSKSRFPSEKISIEDALMISCNNVFRYLVAHNYESNPNKYVKKVAKYGFLDFDFDIDGIAQTKLPSIDTTQKWSYQDLAQLGMGYAVELAPVHLLTLYNGIANGGRMMKPYLVEDIEKDGRVYQTFKPEVLNSSICSKETARIIKDGLMLVTTGKKSEINFGTAYTAFRNSKCLVAGKTGTARMKVIGNAMKGDPYQTADGCRQFQATFAGFFPADNPKYSIITVVYSKPIRGDMYGSACAEVARSITDDIYCLNSEWGEELKEKGSMPKMERTDLVTGDYSFGEVPDLTGLGLMDAIYSIENCGYKCSYEGTGHVRSQSPAAGTRYDKGNTVTIRLK